MIASVVGCGAVGARVARHLLATSTVDKVVLYEERTDRVVSVAQTLGEAAVIAKRNHPLLTPYSEKLTAKHGKFKGNAILSAKIGRDVYFMLQKGTGFDAEQLIATAI